MQLNVEQIKPFIELIGGAVGLLSAVGALWWKLSTGFARAKHELKTLRVEVGKMGAVTLDLTKAVVQLSTKLDEREKDIAKLEGAMEVQRRDLIHVISGLEKATSSMDGMWRTLQALFPEQVPRRASDRV